MSYLYVVLALTAQLLPLVWLVREIVRAVTLPRKSSAEPVCEACRYPVAGLATLRCPECGTDLRRTGIITRPMEMRRRSSLGGAVCGWWILWVWASIVSVFTFGSTLLGAVDSVALVWNFLVAWAMIGGLVTWLIVRRRRRLMRELGDGRPQPPDAQCAHNASA